MRHDEQWYRKMSDFLAIFAGILTLFATASLLTFTLFYFSSPEVGTTKFETAATGVGGTSLALGFVTTLWSRRPIERWLQKRFLS